MRSAIEDPEVEDVIVVYEAVGYIAVGAGFDLGVTEDGDVVGVYLQPFPFGDICPRAYKALPVIAVIEVIDKFVLRPGVRYIYEGTADLLLELEVADGGVSVWVRGGDPRPSGRSIVIG